MVLDFFPAKVSFYFRHFKGKGFFFNKKKALTAFRESLTCEIVCKYQRKKI